MKIKGSGTLKVRGPTTADANFSLMQNPRTVVVSSGGNSDRTVNDVVFTDHTSALADTAFDLSLQEQTLNALDGGQWINLDPSVANLDTVTGAVTRITDGVARIQYKTRLLTRGQSCTMLRQGGVTATTFKNFTSGSLARHITDQIQPLLTGTASARTPIYEGDYQQFRNPITLNTNRWCSSLDFSGFSPWMGSNGFYMGGTLVSPKHLVFATHFMPTVGPGYGTLPIYFIAQDGEVVIRNIVDVVGYEVAPIDIGMCILDSPVPSKIKYYKVLPTNVANYLAFSRTFQLDARMPAICMHQNKHATVADFNYYDPTTRFPINLSNPIDSARVSFFEQVVNGDSSSPAFVVINGEPVLLGNWRFGGAGSFTNLTNATNRSTMNTWMAPAGYSLTEVNLSAFPTYA